jgi:CheY-like chemotaxis protein/HPt (histidine-containing phosphotransfer) domain-containing protein
MGGTMWVESEMGKGSTFHFTLVAPAAPSRVRAHVAHEDPSLRGRRLLIVDDNATNRQILILQAESWGMRPRAAATPAEALEWIRRGDQFDLAILDKLMPEMDGHELAAEIRRYRAPNALPLVMLTSIGYQRDDEADEKAQLAAYLTKPIRASQLYDALIKVFAEQAPQSVVRIEARAARPTLDAGQAERLPLRILLAEDNSVNQKVALRLLGQMGYTADVASNGVEAVDAVQRQVYDVVLMDMQMPEMDGLQATRTIRADLAPERQPRIIAMTANAMPGDRELCLAAGMDDYVAKPIRVDELAAALARCGPVGNATPDAAVEPAGDVLDPAVFGELRESVGDEFLPELIEEFLSDAPQQIALMRSSVSTSNVDELRRAAHSLKTTSATLGAAALADISRAMEGHARDGEVAPAAAMIPAAEAALEQVKRALAGLLSPA